MTRKQKATYEQATTAFTEFYGKVPTVNEMDGIYHHYAGEWKHFDGITDWLIYHQD